MPARQTDPPSPQPPFQQTPSPLPSAPPLRPLSTPCGCCTCAVRPHESVRIYISIRGSLDNQSGTVLRPQNTQCKTAYVLSWQLCAQSTVATGHQCNRRSASLKGNHREEASKRSSETVRRGRWSCRALIVSWTVFCFRLQQLVIPTLSLRLVPHRCL